MAIHIDPGSCPPGIDGAIVATARWSWYAAADGNGAFFYKLGILDSMSGYQPRPECRRTLPRSRRARRGAGAA
jgi:hypothetical protein